ncbi:MAG: amidohydrolase family protein [Planctomycetota bacterium]
MCDLPRLIELLTIAPARVLGLAAGTLSTGAPADVTLLDPKAGYIVEEEGFVSAAINSPFVGWKLCGEVATVLVGGQFKKRDGAML